MLIYDIDSALRIWSIMDRIMETGSRYLNGKDISVLPEIIENANEEPLGWY